MKLDQNNDAEKDIDDTLQMNASVSRASLLGTNEEFLNSNSPILHDIIERLVNFDKYPGYTINETKSGASSNLPYILKEKEIRLLISSAEKVFRD